MKTLILMVFLAVPNLPQTVKSEATLYGTPNTSGKAVTSLDKDTSVEILKESGLWSLVQSKDYVGWMLTKLIILPKLDAATLGGSTILQPVQIVQTPRNVPVTTRSEPAQPRSSNPSYIRGPRGGCYYYSSSGSKVYVSRSLCN